jgi:hypothetical protein
MLTTRLLPYVILYFLLTFLLYLPEASSKSSAIGRLARACCTLLFIHLMRIYSGMRTLDI